MGYGNEYEQFGYDHFDEPSSRKKRAGNPIMKILTSPLTAVLILGTAGAVFSGVLIGSFVKNQNNQQPVPIVKAEQKPFKIIPEDRGGARLAYDDSTVFDALDGGDSASARGRGVENLLDSVGPDSLKAAEPEDISEREDFQEALNAPEERGEDLIQKREPMHAAGSSPETLAFVRSVLDESEKAHSVAEPARKAAAIEPAAGAAIGAAPKKNYFVQLGSVQSASAAGSEWKRYQKVYVSELTGLGHRIQRADLGARGTYFRVQAGPLTKAQASAICDSIKLSKPGACFVTQ